MAILFSIPTWLRPFTEGRSRVRLATSPATVDQALAELLTLHPGIRDRVLTEQGDVRPHINLFVGEENIRDARGLSTAVPDGCEISILPAISGG